MRGELFISGRERNLSSVKRRRRIATPWVSLSPRLVSCARIGQEYVLSRQRINYRESRARRARRKKEKEEEERARGGKRSGSLLETLVERCLTGTCCWWHTSEYLPLLSLQCALSPDHAVPLVLFLLLLLRASPVLSWRTLLHPPCVPLHLFARQPRVSFVYEEARGRTRVGESCKRKE